TTRRDDESAVRRPWDSSVVVRHASMIAAGLMLAVMSRSGRAGAGGSYAPPSMNLRHTLKDLELKGMNGLHRAILKVSGGRWLNRPLGMPTVELHTVGRKSGKPRATLLTAPIHDDRRTVLIASKGGDDRNPEWYLNLVA